MFSTSHLTLNATHSTYNIVVIRVANTRIDSGVFCEFAERVGERDGFRHVANRLKCIKEVALAVIQNHFVI